MKPTASRALILFPTFGKQAEPAPLVFPYAWKNRSYSETNSALRGDVSNVWKISRSRLQTLEKLARSRSRTASIGGQASPSTVCMEATGWPTSPTRNNGLETGEVEADVEAHAVKGNPLFEAEANGRQFSFIRPRRHFSLRPGSRDTPKSASVRRATSSRFQR